MHYTVLYGAKFVLKPAGAVVDKLTHLALVDSVARSLLVEDLKAGPPIAEGSLLLSEFTAAGGMTAIWTNYVVVLRRRCIALYAVEPAGGGCCLFLLLLRFVCVNLRPGRSLSNSACAR